MTEKKFPIGIYLGTVNSVVAVHRHGKTEIIPYEKKNITPSVVFYHRKEKEVGVGNIDKLKHKEEEYDAIYDSKRLIGRSIDDTNLKNRGSNFSFYIKDNKNNKIEIPVKHNGKKVSKMPHEVSSEILKKLKQSAKDYLGYEVKEAVITVPAHFTFSQRHDTKLAADLAGLKVLMLMSEPIAAFLHYIKTSERENSLSLVFDLGGGTLDISIIKTFGNEIKVVAVDEDPWLGGRNFDKAVLDHLIAKHELLLDKQEERRLLTSIEKMKCSLSSSKKTSTVLKHFNDKEKFKIELSRSEFENISSELFEKCINLIKKCLEKSGIEKTKIENIILVGGSTKIPKIKEEISNFFDGKEIITDLDPDKAVACGAAIQASSMKQLTNAAFKIVNVTPFSLGTRLIFDQMKTVIERNTPIPVEKSVITVTAYKNQSQINKKIYMGNRSRCSLNKYLGEVILKNVPQKPAGDITINTTFAIDVSGLLKVKAKEELTGTSTELEIGLELVDLKSTSDTSRKDAEEDEEFLKFVDKLQNLRNSCVKYIYKKKDEEMYVQACKKFISDLENLKFEERNKLPDLVNNFKEKLNIRLLKEISSIIRNS